MTARSMLPPALHAVGVVPAAIAAWCDPLAAACELHDISTARRLAAFVAQCAHESLAFARLEEDLRWRDPARLDAMFSAVRGVADAQDLIRRGPAAIANRVYAGRNGNDGEASGDGFKFRGRGLIQLTGRRNYRNAGRALGQPLELVPDIVLQPAVAAQTAAWFWRENGLNALADLGDIAGITRVVNGPAMDGAEHRATLYRQALAALK